MLYRGYEGVTQGFVEVYKVFIGVIGVIYGLYKHKHNMRGL